jgi:hypothetical protein
VQPFDGGCVNIEVVANEKDLSGYAVGGVTLVLAGLMSLKSTLSAVLTIGVCTILALVVTVAIKHGRLAEARTDCLLYRAEIQKYILIVNDLLKSGTVVDARLLDLVHGDILRYNIET